MKSKKTILFIILFLIVLYALPILILFPGHNKNTENRKLASFPKISNETIVDFPRNFEDFFNDHIPFKSSITKYYSLVMFKLFNTSTQKSVILGDNNFLFYNSKYREASDTAADFSGRGYYTLEQMQHMALKLVSLKEESEKRGMKFCFMVCPNKSSIYPEYIPDYFRVFSERRRSQQFIEYLEENTDIEIINPMSRLMEYKNEYLLYYKNDTHWNDISGFIVSQLVTNRLTDHNEEMINELLISEIYISDKMEERVISLDLSNMLGINGFVKDYAYDIYNYKNEITIKWNYQSNYIQGVSAATKGNLLMFSDSFSHSLRPYLGKEFGTTTYYYGNISDFDWDEYPADYLIYECVERNLVNLMTE